jgi:hypothetical protein
MGQAISASDLLFAALRKPCFPYRRSAMQRHRVIDEMLRILGPNGEHWIQDKLADARGRFCMLGAMQYAQQKLNLTFSAGAGAAIMEAIKQHNDGLFQSIEALNDTQKSFLSVRRVLEAAKTVTPSNYSTAVTNDLRR